MIMMNKSTTKPDRQPTKQAISTGFFLYAAIEIEKTMNEWMNSIKKTQNNNNNNKITRRFFSLLRWF